MMSRSDRLESFWDIKTDARFAGFVRIIFCVLAFGHLLSSFPNGMDFYYGPNGLLDSSLPGFSNFSWSLLPFLSPEALGLFRQVTICALALAAFGIFTRPLLILTLLWHLTAFRLTQPMAWHVDQLLFLMNLYLVFIPMEKRLSLSYWKSLGYPTRFKRNKNFKPLMVQASTFRLIQIQIALIYLVSGVSKLLNSQWQDGTAVAAFFSSWLTWTPINIAPELSVLLSYLVVAVELSIPIAIWFRKTQVFAALAGIGLHFTIAVTTQIFVLSALMILCHLTYVHTQIMQQCHYIYMFFSAKTPPDIREIFRRRRVYR